MKPNRSTDHRVACAWGHSKRNTEFAAPAVTMSDCHIHMSESKWTRVQFLNFQCLWFNMYVYTPHESSSLGIQAWAIRIARAESASRTSRTTFSRGRIALFSGPVVTQPSQRERVTIILIAIGLIFSWWCTTKPSTDMIDRMIIEEAHYCMRMTAMTPLCDYCLFSLSLNLLTRSVNGLSSDTYVMYVVTSITFQWHWS